MSFFINRNTPPPIELVCTENNYLTLARYESGKWQAKSLFPLTFDYHREVRTSPDRQWVYCMTVATLLANLQVGEKFSLLSNALYLSLFSPDSRYLLGNSIGGLAHHHNLSLFDVLRREEVRELSYGKGEIEKFGWYPDSRHIWYALKFPASRAAEPRLAYYRQDVITGKRRVLSINEVKQLSVDWALTDQRFRHGYPYYAYSRHHQIRLRIEGSKTETIGNGLKTTIKAYPYVKCETQEGKELMVLRPSQHRWKYVHGLDITDDGQWALLVGTPEDGTKLCYLSVIDIRKSRIDVVFQIENFQKLDKFTILQNYYDRLFLIDLCYFVYSS